MLENSNPGQAQENYPPFDLIKLGDNDYRIELAVAGFKPNEIDITAQQNVLIVIGGQEGRGERGTAATTTSTAASRPDRSSGGSRSPTISMCAART